MTLDQIVEYLLPIAILLVFTSVGYGVRYFLNVYITAFSKRTKSKIDDIILGAIKTPIVLILFLVGLNTALRYVSLPASIAQYIPLIFEIVIATIAILCTVKIVSGLLRYLGVVRPSIKTIVPTLDKVAKFLIAIIGLMIILNSLGVSVTAPLAALGIGGIAIAFALQSTLSDFLSGIYLMADRPVRVGDYIELESGQKGYVIDIGWRSTRIKELPNNVIVIPNSRLAGTIVTNFYLPEKEMACLVQVGVSYDSDLAKVERVTIDVGKKVLEKVEGGVPKFEPFIRYHTFNDFSINFTVILRVREYVDKYLLTHEFVKALHKRYKEEKIEIPYPIRTIYTRKKES